MELIALSSPDKNKKETDIIQELLEAGLSSYHLRKPGFSHQQIREILDDVDPGMRKRIVLHSFPELASKYSLKGVHLGSSYHKPGLVSQTRRHFMALRYGDFERTITCHSLERLRTTKKGFSALVLSPVFNTISDHNISSGFDEKSIRVTLKQIALPVYALGGIDERTIIQARDMGFSGVVLQGALWRQHHDPLETFVTIRQALRNSVRESSPLSVVKPAVRSA